MQGWPALLSPKVRSFRHHLGAQTVGARLKLIVLVALALGFWVFTFLVFQKVLVYFHSVELFGDLLNYRLLSMMLLTFFSILLFCILISCSLSEGEAETRLQSDPGVIHRFLHTCG